MRTLVVKRSAVKMWVMAMAGVPLLVISLDVLTNRRITNWLREIVFRPDDTQIYEPRDVIWAWVMALFAFFLIIWGLKELFVPTKVLECRDEGLALRIVGPLQPPALIAWDDINDVAGVEIDDDGEKIKLLVIDLLHRGDLPTNPWGARWVNETELGVLAQDWADDPGVVAQEIADYAVENARQVASTRVSQLWREEEE
jgi:hypothetical protein